MKDALLCLSTAFLYMLAFPRWNQSWAAFVCLAPFLVSFSAGSKRFLLLRGLLTAFAGHVFATYWIMIPARLGGWPWPKAVFFSLFLWTLAALPMAVWTALLLPLRRKNVFVFALGAAAAWALVEWARVRFFPNYTFSLLAYTQWRHPALMQMAAATGPYGLSFLIVFVNAAVAGTFIRHAPGKRAVPVAKTAALCAAAVGAAWLIGAWRIHRADRAPAGIDLTVSLLQGNIDQYKKWSPRHVEEIKGVYERLARQAARARPDLILWPETAMPGYVFDDPRLLDWISELVKETGAAHLVGAPLLENGILINGAVLVDALGRPAGVTSKRYLLPFGEYIPLSKILSRIFTIVNPLGRFSPRVDAPVLRAGEAAVGVMICSETLYPSRARECLTDGARLLGALTNEGWFLRSSELDQSHAAAAFRAVETGRWLVRAANTGITAVVDDLGRVRAALPAHQEGVLTHGVAFKDGMTIYGRWGDWFAVLCGIMLLGFLAVGAVQSLRRITSS